MIADGCFCNLILKVCTIRQFKKINDKCQTEVEILEKIIIVIRFGIYHL